MRIASGKLHMTLTTATRRLNKMMPTSSALSPTMLLNRLEAVLLPDRARRRRTQVLEQRFGRGRFARRQNRGGIANRCVRRGGKRIDNAHARVGERAGET